MRSGMVLLMPRLRRFARALSGSWHQADDLVQDTIVRAISALERRGAPEPHGRLAASHHAQCLDRYAEGQEIYGWITPRTSACDPVRDTNAEDATVARLTLGAVDAAMRSLPEDQRTVLLLVCVEEFSYAQTAAVLDIPVGTVMSRLARGRATLRELLHEPASSRPQHAATAIGSAR